MLRRFLRPARGALWCALLVLACDRGGALVPEAEAPPNVLILLGDTVRADHMSTYGYERTTTPRIDAFGARGRVYDRAISPGAWTLPAHASLFTGRDVSAHGVDRPASRLAEEETTIAEVFSAAGYDTFAFAANPFLTERTGLTQGFAVVEHAWDPRWRERIAETIRSRIVEDDVNAATAKGKIDREALWAYQVAGETAHQALVSWLEQRKPGRPFLAFINYMEAHTIWLPSREARERVMGPKLDARSRRVLQSANMAWMAGAYRWEPEDLEALVALYDASLYDWDAAVGGLLEDLERRGVLENTIVVITSDHGESLGEHGRMGHQFNVHGAISHVPLIVVFPKAIPPARVAETISTAELFRLLLELTGESAPAPVEASLRAAASERRERALTEYTVPHEVHLDQLRRHGSPKLAEFDRALVAVEKDGLKLIQGSDGKTELYDVRADPDEKHDLASSRPDVVEKLTPLAARPEPPPRVQEAAADATGASAGASPLPSIAALGYVDP